MCTGVVYDYINNSGLKLYDKMMNASQPRNHFYAITGSSNLSIIRTTLVNSINFNINKLNVSCLSNYCDKATSDHNYYTTTYTNTISYDKD